MSEPLDLFPGFKTPPNAGEPPKQRAGVTVALQPRELEEDDYFDPHGPACEKCDGWGYFDCLCGGDLCVCSYNGERPCWNCA